MCVHDEVNKSRNRARRFLSSDESIFFLAREHFLWRCSRRSRREVCVYKSVDSMPTNGICSDQVGQTNSIPTPVPSSISHLVTRIFQGKRKLFRSRVNRTRENIVINVLFEKCSYRNKIRYFSGDKIWNWYNVWIFCLGW